MSDETKKKKDTSLEDLLAEVEAEFEEAEKEELKETKEELKIEKKQTEKKNNKIETKASSKKDKTETKDKKINIKKETTEEKEVKKVKRRKTDKDDKSLILNDNSELAINEMQLQKIETEMKKQRSIPIEERLKIYKKIFGNILLGVIIVLYFMFVNLGFYNIEESVYLVDLKVFGTIGIVATIVLFEIAYKKESTRLTISGIEILILSILTLITNYLYVEHFGKYPYIINTISMLFAIYYVGKSIITYIKMRKEVLRKISDIRKIIKK